MTRWLDDLRELRHAGEDCFLVTVMDVRGSAPREVGAKMLVMKDEIAGTIGGGQLEHQCTRLGAGHLAAGTEEAFVRRFTLGANCGQCCGGVVEVLFEPVPAAGSAWLADLEAWYGRREPVVVVTLERPGRGLARYLVTADECRAYESPIEDLPPDVVARARAVPAPTAPTAIRLRPRHETGYAALLEPVVPTDFNIALFGAGHTGTAVVRTLAGVDCSLRWIDSRRGVFPQRLPGEVTCIETAHPEAEVAAMPPGAYYLVMTYSHALDYEIVDRVLARGDFAYCGLIGSMSKRRRFERRLRKAGMPESSLERLVCPIGIAGIDSKQPEAIAIAVAAELLQIRTARASQNRNDEQKAKNLRILRR